MKGHIHDTANLPRQNNPRLRFEYDFGGLQSFSGGSEEEKFPYTFNGDAISDRPTHSLITPFLYLLYNSLYL